MFTKDCIDPSLGSIVQKLEEDKFYCQDNPCWDRSVYPFCLCTGDDSDMVTVNNVSYATGCAVAEKKFAGPYVEGETEVYNDSFSDPLIGMVRLVVLISTENYPDVMCELLFIQTKLCTLIWRAVIINRSYSAYIAEWRSCMLR